MSSPTRGALLRACEHDQHRTRASFTFMEPYLTASDLARLYRVALGTIYSWASRDNWRRTETWPRKYHLEDAQASYDRRRGHEAS